MSARFFEAKAAYGRAQSAFLIARPGPQEEAARAALDIAWEDLLSATVGTEKEESA
jgi:hypothetical protein